MRQSRGGYVEEKHLKPQGLCKRRDCAHYSKSVGSCDYRLNTGIGRGCPVSECDKYATTIERRESIFSTNNRIKNKIKKGAKKMEKHKNNQKIDWEAINKELDEGDVTSKEIAERLGVPVKNVNTSRTFYLKRKNRDEAGPNPINDESKQKSETDGQKNPHRRIEYLTKTNEALLTTISEKDEIIRKLQKVDKSKKAECPTVSRQYDAECNYIKTLLKILLLNDEIDILFAVLAAIKVIIERIIMDKLTQKERRKGNK